MTRIVAISVFALALCAGASDRAAAELLPFQAQLQDQSAYALGSFQLNVIFVESDGSIDVDREDWNAEQISTVKSEIAQAAGFWEQQSADLHPAARLRIDVNYVNDAVPINTGYEPISRAHTQDGLWINQVLSTLGYDATTSKFNNTRQFNHDQRLAAGTNWVSTLYVVNDLADANNRFSDGWFAFAFHGGPYAVLSYENNGWGADRFDRVLSHEMAHLFFALDERESARERSSARSGYLDSTNFNSELDADGNVRTAPQPDVLMINNTLVLSDATKIQVGLLDSDGDTIPDILDTFPTLTGDEGISDSAAGVFRFAGEARVSPLNNLNTKNLSFSSSGADMTINTILAAQYRLDGGAWTDVPELAATLGGYEESFDFSILNIAKGDHLIDVRVLNSVDNPSEPLSFDFTSQLVVPEPSAAILAVLGWFMLIAAHRRRR